MEDYSQRISRQKQYLLDSAHIRDAQIVWAVEQQRGKNQDQRWCCAACRAQITDETCLIPIEGQHEHHKVNPQGHAFQFRSFKYAEGCVPIGEPTAEHSWYSGYLWQFDVTRSWDGTSPVWSLFLGSSISIWYVAPGKKRHRMEGRLIQGFLQRGMLNFLKGRDW